MIVTIIHDVYMAQPLGKGGYLVAHPRYTLRISNMYNRRALYAHVFRGFRGSTRLKATIRWFVSIDDVRRIYESNMKVDLGESGRFTAHHPENIA